MHLVLDFDCINDWAQCLTAVLEPHLEEGVANSIARAEHEFFDDARDLLFELTDRDAIIDATLAWIQSKQVVGYHGTRVSDAEVESIRSQGLLPLSADDRRDRLVRALSPHPRWNEIASDLDAAIQAHGPGESAGRRENQVHLTLSRAGLTEGFNHYLTGGSEFDQHVAHSLLGDEGVNLLKRDGQPKVIRIAVPGEAALNAAHPYFDIEMVRAGGEVPNLIGNFLTAWSYRLAKPDFQSRTLKADIGMVFDSVVPSDWILEIEDI